MLAIVAGALSLGVASTVDAGPTTTPIVLDAAALESVTAGFGFVGAEGGGQAFAIGSRFATAEVNTQFEASGTEQGGTASGLVSALGFGLGSTAGSDASSSAAGIGNLLSFNRTVPVRARGADWSLDLSVSIAVGVSVPETQLPQLNGTTPFVN